jgi:hypothetical protein
MTARFMAKSQSMPLRVDEAGTTQNAIALTAAYIRKYVIDEKSSYERYLRALLNGRQVGTARPKEGGTRHASART